jgi:hypothetical protein
MSPQFEEGTRVTGFKAIYLADILRLQPVLICRALRPLQGVLEEFIKRMWHGEGVDQLLGKVSIGR